ncbi:MAG TPA: DUF1761 domain-containing protein [Chlamydiales bacterium]|nr:DUF1761 domain-containing protein [Chlamydiales bacterium]
METIDIDFLTALVAAIIYMLLGAFWYSPLMFGKLWKTKNIKHKWTRFLIAFISAYVMAIFLSIVEAYMGSASTMDGIYIGIGIWLGFIVTTHLPYLLWKNEPFSQYLANMGFYFCGYAIMGGIIGA